MIDTTDVHSVGASYPNYTPSTTIPKELTRRGRWVCWRYNEDKSKKPPVDPVKGRLIDWSDPGKWLRYSAADTATQEHGHDGIGFVLTSDDPFTVFDFDGCGDRSTGYVHPAVMVILEQLGNPYAEWSPGGRGIRAVVEATKPAGRCRTDKTPWGDNIEMYDRGRFFTVTGNVFQHGGIPEAQEAIEDLYGRYFPAPSQAVEVGNTTATPLPDPIDLTDGELLDKARAADKLGWKFEALFDRGNTSVSKNDASAADNDLMMQLAFWTGKDADRMGRLFSESALGQRDKWKTRPDYRRRTIAHAIANTRGVYEPEQHRPNKTKTRDSIREMVAQAVLLHPWAEKAGRADAGATDFFGTLGMLRRAHAANTLEVDISVRDYMEAAGISDFTTALKSLDRLTNTHRWVDKVRDGGPTGASRYRIRVGSKPKHIEIRGNSSTQNPPRAYDVCAGLLIPLAGAHLIRNSSPEMPEYDRHGRKIPRGPAPLVKSVGKAAAMVAYVVAATAPIFGGVVPPEFVSDRTGITVKNLKARHVPRLAAAGLVDTVEGGYAPPVDVKETLKEELRVSGSLAAANHQRQRHDRQRRAQEIKRLAWLGHDAEAIAAETGFGPDEIAAVVTPPDEAPTKVEMDAARLAKGADGPTSELVKESPTWAGEFPHPDDNQQPLGHDFQEAPQEAVSRPEPVRKGTAPPDDTEAVRGHTEALDETPCIHSGLGYVFPGGRGCYCCDPDHPMRQHERENGVVSLDAYRRERVV